MGGTGKADDATALCADQVVVVLLLLKGIPADAPIIDHGLQNAKLVKLLYVAVYGRVIDSAAVRKKMEYVADGEHAILIRKKNIQQLPLGRGDAKSLLF